MGLFTSFANALNALIFNNTALPNIGDASGLQPSAAAGNLYIALYTADPGAAGDADTNEIAYTDYARIPVARNSGGLTVNADGTIENAAQVAFPECGTTGATATHAALVASASGATRPLASGPLNASRVIADGDVPRFAAGELVFTLS